MNIYISGLSYGTNDADLTNLFAEYGEVSSAKAIDELNGVEYDQKVISVSVARPRAEKPSYGGNRGGGYNNSRRY